MKTIIKPLWIAAANRAIPAIPAIPATLALAFMVAVPRTSAQAEPVRQEAGPEQHKAALLRSWHEQRLLPYDPPAAARLALSGFMVTSPSRVAGGEGYFRPNFGSLLLPHPLRSSGQWDYGDCSARAFLAWPGSVPMAHSVAICIPKPPR